MMNPNGEKYHINNYLNTFRIKDITQLIVLLMTSLFSLSQEANNSYDTYPVYKGDDLGVRYNFQKTNFKVWAPLATAVKLRLYMSGDKGSAIAVIDMDKDMLGTWKTTVNKNIKNQFYTFQVKQDDKWLAESPDIYAKAVGVNGKRGMVINLTETDPVDWNNDKRPPLKNFTDIILYETHVRDFSIDENSGIKNKGKFLGFTEAGTRSPDGASTGLDHLKDLGITHVHFLPSFDFRSLDESKPDSKAYNWGYDPLNFDTPEGSYSTDPYDGKIRIKEFKQMVHALHTNGMRVILDVVYNHTGNLSTPFNQFAPGYFYRHNANGTYSNGSGTGNETASERAMMQQFMIASVIYWAKEYHLDGFRFDLMGLHDINTMNLLTDALHKIDPTIFVYGEGWAAGASPYPESLRAVKKNISQVDKVAVFSDDIRDGLRGPFSNNAKGFVSGANGFAESVKFGIVASTQHPQINYQSVRYSKAPWAKEPYQTINYVSCHDDPTLFDRLKDANPDASEIQLIKMDKLAQTVVFTSQGVPFLHSGAEMLRTKQGVHNSYKSPDSINQLDWSRKTKYKEVYSYYKALIKLRKDHPAFRMLSTKMIQEHLNFIDTKDSLVIAYSLSGIKEESWKQIIVIFNGDTAAKTFRLPAGQWTMVCDGDTIDEKSILKISGSIDITATSACIAYKTEL